MPTMIVLVDGTIPVAADFMANFNALNQAIGTGTVITGYTVGDLLYASATTALSKLAIGLTGQVPVVSSGLPAWGEKNVYVGFGDGTVAIAAGETKFYGSWASVVTTDAIAFDHIMPFGGTVRNVYVVASTAPTAGQSFVLTLQKNGADQAVTATMANAATTANDTAHSFAVAAGDRVSVKIVASAAAASASLRGAFEVIRTT